MAAALKRTVQIFTDVDGVYITDPRVEPKARKLDKITFEEMHKWPAWVEGPADKIGGIRREVQCTLRVLSSFGRKVRVPSSPLRKRIWKRRKFWYRIQPRRGELTILRVPDQLELPSVLSDRFPVPTSKWT